ncbi:MAG: NAD(P)/FAD-dependent oxidoreductase [Candidatus Paceibacterota bacterium]|jgi:hypothetical protein
MIKEDKIWDVIVIGGGPAGMMAAGRAAERGLSVLLIEKNEKLGKKLLITGGGRCNVTNAEENVRKLLSKYKDSDKFLFSAFSQYGVKETLDFFHSNGMETKIEPGNRIFPINDKSQSVLDVLVSYIKKNKVTIQSNSPVTGFVKDGSQIDSVRLADGIEIKAKSFILATGGKSRPETGSTGDGFNWLRELGHTITDSEPCLVPISIKDSWLKKLQGVTLPEVKITVLQNNEKQEIKKGKILFTHFGLSGPSILNMSKDIGELLKYGSVFLSLDILSNLDYGQLNLRLQEIFQKESKKKFKNCLGELIPSALIPIVIELSKINPDIQANGVSREERLGLVQLLKDIRIEVKDLLGTDKAIITSGGVSLEEINFKTMQSKLYPNLYLIGDILDIDRPSGGYSLQLCWTTGFVAGDSV